MEDIKVSERLIAMGRNFYGNRAKSALFYSTLVMILEPRVVVEIGSCHGFSACCFGIGLKEIHQATKEKGRIWAIDIKEKNTRETKENAERLGVDDYVRTLTGDGATMVEKTFKPCSIDLLFVDGSHETSNVYNDIMKTFRFVKQFGYILCDDYSQEQCRQGIDRAFFQKEGQDRNMERIYLPGIAGWLLVRKLTE